MSEVTEPLQDLESISKALGTQTEKPEKETEENDIVVVEDHNEAEAVVDQEEEVEEEPPKKKFKRDKRIEGLLKKNTAKDTEIEELKKQMSELSRKDQERSNKETDIELEILDKKKKEAFEASDYEGFKKYESQMNGVRQNTKQMTAEEAAQYFKSKNLWYEVDEAKTYAAQGIHSKILSDDNYRHLTAQQQLDVVAEQVNEMPEFKKNPYQQSSPTEGAPMSRPSKNQVTITRTQLESVRQMFPELNERELKVRTRELVTSVEENEERK